MKKLVILIFAFVLVFGLFVQIGFCDGDNDECTPSCPDTCPGHSCPSDCNCDDSCSSGTLTSTSKITYYYAYGQQKSYNFGTKQYYSSPPTFTDEDYYTYSCYPDGCGGYCCTCCGCDSSTISCKGWQKCYDDDSFGCPDDSTGCKCEDEYCKGWCMDNAPVYDGLAACSAASDGDWVATTAFSSKPAKYKLNTDYHSANMNGGCYCNYYEIKNFYECDSAKINDSHPCSSNNCAPDFAGGRNYCCKSGYCSHRGNDAICLNCGGFFGKEDKTGSGTQSDVHCYESGAIVRYQGYKFKCNNGNWEFIGGEKNDFSDNCGKTIFNYPLFFNINNFYPDGYGYKNSYAIYPVLIPQYIPFINIEKDLVVSVTPNNIVEINGESTRYKVFEKKTGRFDIKFKGNEEGNPFNLTINCYTPDEKPCSPEYEDCWPGSYCSQDQPTNIILESNPNIKPKFRVRFLNNANITCYLATEKNKNPDTPFLNENNTDITKEYELNLEEYNVISCNITTNNGKSGFDSALTKYFDFGDDDGSIFTKDNNCEANAKWKYSTTAPERDGKKWYEYDYDDSSWSEGNQPFGGYEATGCTKRQDAYSNPFCDPVDCEFLNTVEGINIQYECTNPYTAYASCCEYKEEGQTACTPNLLRTAGTKLYLRKKIEPNYYFFCCPNNTCAHRGICYEEGTYRLKIPGEEEWNKTPEGCLWNCKNNVWGKQLEGAKCEKNCDCNLPNETNYHCVQTLYNLSKKICCPIGYCGLNAESGKCVPKGKLAGTGKYSKCICNGNSWDCVNTEIETDYSRILFSENSKEYEISLEIKKTKLKDINSANATVIVFFDNRSYSGNIKITGYDDCFFISTTKPIKEKFEFSKNFASITDGFKCKLKIEAPDLKENEYFFYTSSALILEYI